MPPSPVSPLRKRALLSSDDVDMPSARALRSSSLGVVFGADALAQMDVNLDDTSATTVDANVAAAAAAAAPEDDLDDGDDGMSTVEHAEEQLHEDERKHPSK